MGVFIVKSNETGAARSAIMVGLAVSTQVILSAYNQYSPATSIGWRVFISSTWGRYQLHRFYELLCFFPVAPPEYVGMTRFSAKITWLRRFLLETWAPDLVGTYSPGGAVGLGPGQPVHGTDSLCRGFRKADKPHSNRPSLLRAERKTPPGCGTDLLKTNIF